MSLRSSGLWCDLCGKPIFHDPYWDISFKRMNGDNKKGHSCNKCKIENEKKKGKAE